MLPPVVESEIQSLLADLRGNLSEPLATRTRVFNDFARGKLVTLLAIGLSLRQAASALGVSHTAVRGELKRNPELLEQVNAARFQAQIEPLLVIIRESRRSWRAATWLVKYLQARIMLREGTPEEAAASSGESHYEHQRAIEIASERLERDREERRMQHLREETAKQFPKRKSRAKKTEGGAG